MTQRPSRPNRANQHGLRLPEVPDDGANIADQLFIE